MADGLATAVREEIRKLLAPLVVAASVPHGPSLLLRAVGHLEELGRNPALAIELARIAALVEQIDDLTDGELRSWNGIARLLRLVDEAISAVRGLDGVLPSQASGAGRELTELLLGRHLRTHHPRLFRVLAAGTLATAAETADPEPVVVDPAGTVVRLPWTRDRIRFDRTVALFDDAPAVFAEHYLPGDMRLAADAHLGADRLFPALGFLASSLGLGHFTELVRLTPEPPPASDDDEEEPDLESPNDPDVDPPARPADRTALHRDFLPRLGIYLPRQEDGVPTGSRFGLTVLASSAAHPGGARGYTVTLLGEAGWSESRGDWEVGFTATGALPSFVIGPGGVQPTGPQSGATFTLRRVADDSFVLGAADGSRIELSGVHLGAEVMASPERNALIVSAAASSAVLVLTAEPDDGFLGLVLPDDGVRVPFDLAVRLSSDRGLELRGGAGLELSLRVDRSLGPVTMRTLHLRFAPPLAVTATGDFEVALGPLTVTVQDLGLRLDLAGPPDDVELNATLKLPDGLGAALDAGVVRGAGVLDHDPETGRYAGELAVQLERLSIVGVGLLDTRAQGVDFALLVLLSARFEPGIQLGWGFELTGVGGLIAVNHRIDMDALHERFATGAAARLLAVEAVTEASNLSAILRDVDAIFPVADGIYVVGPTVRLLWLRLVTIDAGVFLEFPGPTRVVVLGTARATVNNPLAKGPLVQLRADFVGVLDLERATFAFDATLIDSRLLESFPLTGDILFRAGWGDEPYTVMSVGGFHPDFHPGNLPVPKTIDRLAMSYGHPDDNLYLRFEGYFAITSNSVQFGASVEVSAKLGPFRIMGFIGFDALIRFEPFYFSISFEARVRLKWKGRTLAGISVHGTLSGPGPVKFTGRACIEMLFFDICKSGSFEIGSDVPPVVREIPSALLALALELRDPANLRAATEDRSVVLRALPADPPVLAPTGVIWEQTQAPLGLLLERFEGTPLGQAETVTASSEQLTGEELDWFAPGSFSELSDAEALTRRSFERLPSGLRLAAGADDVSVGVDHDVEVVEFLLPAPVPSLPDLHPSITAPGWLLEAVQVREGLAEGRLAARAFDMAPERWRVVDVDGGVLATTGESQAHQLARSVGRGAVALPAHDQITLSDA